MCEYEEVKSNTFDTEHTYVGCVKWFNNKTGYGFITSCDDKNKDEDIFVHHTGLVVSDQQYTYLVQGEYVEFKLSATDNTSKYPYQASCVTGMWGGKLMCETRNAASSTTKNTKKVKKRRYTNTNKVTASSDL